MGVKKHGKINADSKFKDTKHAPSREDCSDWQPAFKEYILRHSLGNIYHVFSPKRPSSIPSTVRVLSTRLTPSAVHKPRVTNPLYTNIIKQDWYLQEPRNFSAGL